MRIVLVGTTSSIHFLMKHVTVVCVYLNNLESSQNQRIYAIFSKGVSRLLESTVSFVYDVHILYCCICPSFFFSFCRLNRFSIVDTIEALCVLVNHGYIIYFCFPLTMEAQRAWDYVFICVVYASPTPHPPPSSQTVLFITLVSAFKAFGRLTEPQKSLIELQW